MRKLTSTLVTKTLVTSLFVFGLAGAALAEETNIHNQTGLWVQNGSVIESGGCSDIHGFTLNPGETKNVDNRGACLLTGIYAEVCGPDRNVPCVQATPYLSSGTRFSCFVITGSGSGPFNISDC
jgi:hypothetical protein